MCVVMQVFEGYTLRMTSPEGVSLWLEMAGRRSSLYLTIVTLSVATFILNSNIPFPTLDMLFVLEGPKTFHLELLKVDADIVEN